MLGLLASLGCGADESRSATADAGVFRGTVDGHWLLTVAVPGETPVELKLSMMQDQTSLSGAFCFSDWVCDEWDLSGTLSEGVVELMWMTQMDDEIRYETLRTVVDPEGSTMNGTIVAYSDPDRTTIIRSAEVQGERVQ